MCSSENSDDLVAISQLNSELQHAHLELVSAHCATHQLRRRFSADDLARFGRRDILRKSLQAANALSEYYNSIEQRIPTALVPDSPMNITEEDVLGATRQISSYFRQQRDRYFAAGLPLGNSQKDLMGSYFSPPLLDRVRIVQLAGERIPNPSFYEEFRARGFADLPQMTHMHSITFVDVVVFNERVTERVLFHGLVHAVQFAVLGLDRYVDLFVRRFLQTKLHFSVPLEAHAFALESKFASSPANYFSVEDQVRLWERQERY